MINKHIIYHTPGAFGNFLAYIIDSHQAGEMLPNPFTSSGNSHQRKCITQSKDIVLSENYRNFNERKQSDRCIGIYWPEEYFFYILHATYGRTMTKQNGVNNMQENLWDYINQHPGQHHEGNDWSLLLNDLQMLFNFDCNENNQSPSRGLLRQLFFFYFCNAYTNKLYLKNKEISQANNMYLINIEQILDYNKLSKLLKEYTGVSLNFKDSHETFLSKNTSLTSYYIKNDIVNAILEKKQSTLPELDVITQAGILFELEKYFYDIPFHNLNFNFKNTNEIIDYIQHFPNHMKSPNPFFAKKLYNHIKRIDHDWFNK